MLTFIVCSVILAILSWLVPRPWRPLAWLLLSVCALYALEPAVPDFATITLIVIAAVWLVIRRDPFSRADWITGGSVLATAFGALIVRSAATLVPLVAILGLVAASVTTVNALIPGVEAREYDGTRQRIAVFWIILLVAALVVLKTATLSNAVQQSLAVPTLAWFGYSYIAFRLIHVLLDYRSGKLGSLALRDFILYVIFFPALTAGPIDRVQRFSKDVNAEQPFSSSLLVEGGLRIVRGLFYKFVLADSLAFLALNPILANAPRQPDPIYYWIMMYAYAFRIFFDFAGYTEIAIGIGRLMGFRLPENFNRPYTQRSLAQFWNNWHITLSTWYRYYVFTPLSRELIRARWTPQLAAFAAQVTTMILIGLWHGVTWNFVLWGVWHGVGLYAHRTITTHLSRLRQWQRGDETLKSRPGLTRLADVGYILVTFHYVALGWIFFALPDVTSSLKVFAGLVGWSL